MESKKYKEMEYKNFITKENSVVEKVKELEKLKKINPKLYKIKLKQYQDLGLLPKL